MLYSSLSHSLSLTTLSGLRDKFDGVMLPFSSGRFPRIYYASSCRRQLLRPLLLLSLLLLHTFSLLKLFSLQLLFSHRNMIFDVILHVLVPLEKHLLFKLLFLLSLFLDAILLLITLLNMHDVLSFFLSFLDLFPCL